MPRLPHLRLATAAVLSAGLALAAAGPGAPDAAASAEVPVAAAATSLRADDATATPTTAPTASDATRGLAYVALGDSYAAGYGLTDPTGEPVSGCSQSAHDYPHQVAEALDLELTDVSCSGATTADVVNTRQDGAAPQSSALGTKTKVVTLTIGGNDAGLFSTASSCIALSKNGPILSAAGGASCRSTLVHDGVDSLKAAVRTTVATGLAKTLATIKSKAPNAQVFVVGYPAVFPDAAHTPAAGCFRPVFSASSVLGDFPTDGFPFTQTDVSYLHGVQVELDDAMRAATTKAGFHYVETLAATEAHSGCATTASYMNGITLNGTVGLTHVSLVTGALHPNARGAAFLADTAARRISSTLEAERASASASAGPRVKVIVVDTGPLGWVVLAAGVVVAAGAVFAFGRRRRRRSDDEPPR